MCVPLAHAGALIPTYIAVVLALGFLSQPHCGLGVFSGRDGEGEGWGSGHGHQVFPAASSASPYCHILLPFPYPTAAW